MPGQQVFDVLEHDCLGRARQRGLSQRLVVHAGGIDQARFEEFPSQPVERGGRQRNAVSRADTSLAVDTCLEHGYTKLPVSASVVASARELTPIFANSRARS